MANWPPPMGKPQDHQTKIKNDFPIGFFTFLLLLPREIVLERERTMANEEHFFYLPEGLSTRAPVGSENRTLHAAAFKLRLWKLSSSDQTLYPNCSRLVRIGEKDRAHKEKERYPLQ